MSFPKPYYDDGDGIVIYHGDALGILPGLSSAHLAVTDPPYGINMSGGLGGVRGFGGVGAPIEQRRYVDAWDDERPSAALFAVLLARCERAIIWGGNFFADLLPRSAHWLVWDKLNTMPSFSDCELAWTNVDRKSVKKKTVEWNGLLGKERERVHPTQKPLELISWCIENYSEMGQTILDPFMGSGTTLRAAKDLGRKCMGIESEERYCEIAAKRLAQEVLPLRGRGCNHVQEDVMWEKYARRGFTEMRAYVPGEDLSGIGVGRGETPELGGMIARDPANHTDQWYVARAYVEQHFTKREHGRLVQFAIDTVQNSIRDLVALDSDGRLWERLSEYNQTTRQWIIRWEPIAGPP